MRHMGNVRRSHCLTLVALGVLLSRPAACRAQILTPHADSTQLATHSLLKLANSSPSPHAPKRVNPATMHVVSPASLSEQRDPHVVLTREVYIPGHERAHPELCPSLGVIIQLLVLVTSAPSHEDARNAVRLTWGHYAARTDIALAFVLGTPPPALRAAIDAEDVIYGDLIMGRYVDSYSNLTLKTLSMLEWVDTYCPRAPRLLKTDDDMFVNIPQLLNFAMAPGNANATRTIWGNKLQQVKPRGKKSKYYVSPLQYSARVFPDYVMGCAYLMTTDCVRPLRLAALPEPYVLLEDVFVTGVVATRLGLLRLHVPEFYSKKRVTACTLQRSLSIHNVKFHEQFELWGKLLDGMGNCTS